ncbi:MAG: glycosyltransferase family 4 protein [Clostridia bacterium]|nr:glycosyltransferase family 4 protein [Clostridia bacterium]
MIKVINVISDTNIGGAGKCVLTFLKHYDKSKFKVLAVIPENSLLAPEIEKLGGQYITCRGIADKSLGKEGIRALKRIFREQAPDIIHTHGCMSARIAGRLYGKAKIIYTRHSVFEPSPKISRGIGKLINGMVNNATADKIIAVAEAAKDNLTATGVDAKKILVIQNGVEPLKKLPEDEKNALRSAYNVADGELLLGIVARLNEVKGHVYLLEAVKLLRDEGFKFKLLIAGTGDYEENIRRKANELGIADDVIMAGFVSDVTGIMNILDVNMNASYGTEATSLSLLEGMSLGVPAIVSDFGGNPGVVTHGDNGLIFRTKDSADLADKLRMFMSDETLRKKLGENSLRIFDKKFTAEINTKNIENVYISTLGKDGINR